MTGYAKAITATLVLLILAATSAWSDTGPYVGFSAGHTEVDVVPGEIGPVGFVIKDGDFAYKVYFGFELPGPLAVEGGFRDLGTVTDENGLTTVTSESDGLEAFVLGKLPLGPVSLFAKGGFIAWDSKLESRSRGGLGIPDVRLTDDGTDFAWGLGVAVGLGKFGIRGEYEQLEIDLPSDLTVVSVGLTYKF